MKNSLHTILFLSTSDTAFLAHRLPMANAARNISQRVVVVCANTGRISEIKKMGFDVYHLPTAGRSSLSLLRIILTLIRIYRSEQPQIIHHSSVLMCFIGSIARLFYRPINSINAITGVGYLFSSESFKARLFRTVLTPVLRVLWSQRKTTMLFQNVDDRALLAARDLAPLSAPIIKGSGVNTKLFKPKTEKKLTIKSAKPLIFGCATRLIRDKGLEELIKAVNSFGAQDQFELHIAGSLYKDNPTSVSQADLTNWASVRALRLKGQLSDMPAFWHESDIAILPSHREGLPKALLEAAACGLPLLGADVPGTREIIRHGQNGLLFKKGDVVSIAAAIKRMIEDPTFRMEAGRKSREMVETGGFSDEDVSAAYKALLTSM